MQEPKDNAFGQTKIVLTFNYKDGTKTITWDEAKEALEKAENGSDLEYRVTPKP